MNFTDREKELLLENAAVLSRLTLYDEDNSVLQVFTDDDYIVDWDYEDYRYVPDQGFIGQFVERLLDGHFINIPDDISLENKEIEMEIAVKDPELEEQVYHSYGRFIITKIEKEDASGSYKFEASDYTKKFNVAYDSSVNYPCLAIELLNDAANKAEVYLAGNDTCLAYAVTENGLRAGNYCFATYVENTLTYFNFTTEKDLSYRDSLMLVASKGKVIQRVVNEDYSVTETEIVYASSTTQVGTLLSNEELSYVDFINNNFVIEDNQFVENNSCREVVSAIAKLGYTWARVGTDNKLHLDFVKKSEEDVDSYDEIDTDKYYEATVTGDKVEPINKVLIGMSQVEGENIVKEQDNDLLGVDTIYGETSQKMLLGINRIKNGDFSERYTNWNNWGSPPTRAVIYDETLNKYVAHIISNTTKFQGYQQSTGVSVTPNKKYTVSVTAKGNYLCVGIHWNNSSGTIVAQSWTTLINSNQTDYKTYKYTFTCPNDNSITKFNIMIGDNSDTAHEVWYTNIQLQEGEQATDYEDFTNLLPSPSPYRSQSIVNVGGGNDLLIENKNLYDASYRRANGTIFTSGGVSSITEEDGVFTMVASGTDAYIWEIGLQYGVYQDKNGKLYKFDNNTYTIKVDNSLITKNFVTYYDKNKTSLGFVIKSNTQFTVSKSDKEGAEYFSLRFGNGSAISGTTYEFNVEMEKGTTVGDFTPHSEKRVPLNFPTENLFNINSVPSWVGNNTTYSVDGNTLTVSGNYFVGYLINVKKNTNYYVSTISEVITQGSPNVTGKVRIIQTNQSTMIHDWGTDYSFNSGDNSQIYLMFYSSVSSELSGSAKFTNTMLCEGDRKKQFTPCTYDENLFDKDNVNDLNAYFVDGTNNITADTSGNNKTIYIPCKPNTTYTIQKTASPSNRAIGYTTTTPAVNVAVQGAINIIANTTTRSITTGNNAQYLVIRVWCGAQDTITYQQMLDSVQIKEHIKTLEICSIDNYDDYEDDTVNLFDYIKALQYIKKEQYGATITNNRDGSFTISGTGNLTGNFGGGFTDLTHEQTVKLLRVGTLKFKCDYNTVPRLIVEGYDGSTMLFQMWNRDTSVQTTTITQEMLNNSNFKLRLSFYAPSGLAITPVTIHPMLYQDGDGTFEPIKYKKIKDYITRSTGKNLIHFLNRISETKNGVTCSIDENDVITLNGTATTNSDFTKHYAIQTLPNKPYTLNIIYISGSATGNVGIYNQDGQHSWFGWDRVGTIAGNYSVTHTFPYSMNLTTRPIRAFNGVTYNNLKFKLQFTQSDSADYEYEPYGIEGEWYKCSKIGKWVMGNNYTWANSGAGVDADAIAFKSDTPNITDFSNSKHAYIDRFIAENDKQWINDKRIGTACLTANYLYVRVPKVDIPNLTTFNTWVASNPISVYTSLNAPTYEKITYQPLIDQLNELQDIPLFEGTNHITVDTLNEQPSLDITVTDLEQDSTSYSGKSFEITGHDYDKGGSIYIYDNPLTYTEALRRIAINGAEKLYGLTYTPMTINSIGHPWLEGDDFVKLTNLEENDLYFYPFDRKMSYKGYITTDLSATAENQVKEKYENPNNILNRLNHTEIDVDKANQRIDLIAEQTSGNTQNITNMQLDITGINQSVQHIEDTEIAGLQSQISTVNQTMNTITNMFQISGGINVIRNSAFLLQDAVWEFTNNGTNPYYTPLGSSYNVALSGTTTSVAEIKLRSVKVKSKSENVTNLILGTKYTFNFYHKQDNNMTTTIKMYSTENNNVKAFNDIVITGQQGFRNYEVSFTPTTYANYTIEIIVTSTASVGYAYIYDMMLNSGDKQSWQPASDEIYSTTLQMSRLGLQVYSVGDGTITILGSDGMATYETTDGKTLGRLVSLRNIDGDRTRVITTQAVYLTKDITQENDNKWVETIVTISGSPYKVEYVESGE